MKLLKVVFVILIIVTLVELGYYFYTTKQQSFIYQTNTASRTVEIAQQTTNQNEKCVKDLGSLPPNITPAVHSDVISILRVMGKDSGSSLQITSTTKKTVVDIAYNGIESKKGKFFPFGLKLKREPNNDFWLYYDYPVIGKIKVNIVINNEKHPAKLSSIKVGDTIKLVEIYDPSISPTDPGQLIEETIDIER